MRRILCGLVGVYVGATVGLAASSGKVLKVLPHYLDLQGRHAVSPSLYERDAYQADLRRHPERISGLRFDIHWQASHATSAPLRLRAELLTTTSSKEKPIVLEQAVKPGFLGRRWSPVKLDGAAFKAAGELIAWRVTLWEGDTQLGEQRSFLW